MKSIVHFIDSLAKGGAETLLINYIKELPQYNHIIVTFYTTNHFEDITVKYKIYQLNLQPKKNFLRIIISLRKIIKSNSVKIIHSHSYWTNIYARLSAPSNIKVLNHYHFADYDTKAKTTSVRRMLWLDRLIGHKNLLRIGVSEYVGLILENHFRQSRIIVLPNFISCESNFYNVKSFSPNNNIKIIAIGNMKWEKGYDILINAFTNLEDYKITMDVYGDGNDLEFFRNQVQKNNINSLYFKGISHNIKEIICDYDLYCSTSISETFGMALLQAVCAGLPLLVSDIPAFKEVAPVGTVFFKKNDINDFLEKLTSIYYNGVYLDDKEYQKKLNEYSIQKYIDRLKSIYN